LVPFRCVSKAERRKKELRELGQLGEVQSGAALIGADSVLLLLLVAIAQWEAHPTFRAAVCTTPPLLAGDQPRDLRTALTFATKRTQKYITGM